jgi:RNA polymerase sigma-70 factor (ECF subfamily)
MPPDFDALVEKHSAEIFAYLYRFTRDEAEAQDCLQDTYLRAYRAYARLDGRANQRAWLYRIATNVALTHLRRRTREHHRRAALDDELADGQASPSEVVIRKERLAALAAAVERLPAQQRAALILRQYQALSYRAVAQALHCSEAAARANVYQALQKLRQEFRNAEDR